MIVLDASSLLEFLLNTATERQVGVRIVDPDVILHVPHLADIEVAQSLRRQVRSGAITATEGGEVLTTLQRRDMVRHAHQRCCRWCGGCEKTSPLMTRSMSPWQRRWMPSC